MAGAGAGLGAVGACESVDAGTKPCFVGPYATGGVGHTPKMYKQTMNFRKLALFPFGLDFI